MIDRFRDGIAIKAHAARRLCDRRRAQIEREVLDLNAPGQIEREVLDLIE